MHNDYRLFDAVCRGTCDAIWQMITNATHAPCADFYATLKDGVADGIVRIGDDRDIFPPPQRHPALLNAPRNARI